MSLRYVIALFLTTERMCPCLPTEAAVFDPKFPSSQIILYVRKKYDAAFSVYDGTPDTQWRQMGPFPGPRYHTMLEEFMDKESTNYLEGY